MSDSTLTKDSQKYAGWKVSREEYLKLPDDGFKYDMIGGILELRPNGFIDHGNSQMNFGRLLGNFVHSRKLGKLVSEVDIFLPDGGDVLRPDICLVLNDNLSITKGHIYEVPDLICEVLSEITRKRDLGVKADRYLLNGVKEYWIIDTDAKVLFVWVNRNTKAWEKREGEVVESQLLQEFVVRRDEFFN